MKTYMSAKVREDRTLETIDANPGIMKSKLYAAVGGNRATLSWLIDELVAEGVIEVGLRVTGGPNLAKCYSLAFQLSN